MSVAIILVSSLASSSRCLIGMKTSKPFRRPSMVQDYEVHDLSSMPVDTFFRRSVLIPPLFHAHQERLDRAIEVLGDRLALRNGRSSIRRTSLQKQLQCPDWSTDHPPRPINFIQPTQTCHLLSIRPSKYTLFSPPFSPLRLVAAPAFSTLPPWQS